MAEQIIPQSDSNELKVKQDAEKMSKVVTPNVPELNDKPKGEENASLFDVAGTVNPSERSEDANMPESPDPAPEKRGRGRPKGTGSSAAKKKPAAKMSKEDIASVHIANANMIVSALDVLRAGISGGECPANPEMRGAAVGTWAEYLETQGLLLPPWVQVGVVSIMYVAPAFATQKGRGFISGAVAKVRGWYIAWKG